VKASERDMFEELDARIRPKPTARDWSSSMGQDIAKGRDTEIAYMNGYIVRKGDEANIPTPVNTAIVELVKEIESGKTEPNPSNAERVLATAGL